MDTKCGLFRELTGKAIVKYSVLSVSPRLQDPSKTPRKICLGGSQMLVFSIHSIACAVLEHNA